jgi:hypothetical protein
VSVQWVVEFHADGGQACVLGRRVFNDPVEAGRFAQRCRDEKGHTCRDSVREYVALNASLKDDGRLARC